MQFQSSGLSVRGRLAHTDWSLVETGNEVLLGTVKPTEEKQARRHGNPSPFLSDKVGNLAEESSL